MSAAFPEGRVRGVESDTEEKLREIVARIGEISKDFEPNAHLRDDLNVDSFRAVEIVFEIEGAFQITVPGARYADVEPTARSSVGSCRAASRGRRGCSGCLECGAESPSDSISVERR
jgi:acyl carrier protein